MEHGDLSNLARNASPAKGWAIVLASGLIVAATAAAFSSSFAGGFVFDDQTAIVENRTIRQLWPIWTPLCPPAGTATAEGRPLLNFSLAINYAMSGYDVWSYHAANLAIHILAALLLFGILRRTFLLPTMRDRWGGGATVLAFVIALLWAIHPLQTESVTYIVQRAESLMGLFYFLTLYCFIRGVSSAAEELKPPTGATAGLSSNADSTVGRANRGTRQFRHDKRLAILWYSGSLLACLFGMATKEVMVSAPLIVLLYDRTFCAGSFREAWRRRHALYLALGGTWLALGCLVMSAGNLGNSGDFSLEGFTRWSYLMTQSGVILHYLRLALWPSPLCLDYGWLPPHSIREVLLPAILVVGLIALVMWALSKRPAWGFLGVWFFAILAPTSSFLPLRQAAYEHRMYLPLAAVATGFAAGGWLAGRRLGGRRIVSRSTCQLAAGVLLVFAVLTFEALTFLRNLDYRSNLSIWENALVAAPGNPRVHFNLGRALAGNGQLDEAIAQYQAALDLKPDYADCHNNLGNVLAARGQLDEATAQHRMALEINPRHLLAHANLASVLSDQGHLDEAIFQYRSALEINPAFVGARYQLARVLVEAGQPDEAIVEYEKVLDFEPDFPKARYNLGRILYQQGKIGEAIGQWTGALRLQPQSVLVLHQLAHVLATGPYASVRDGPRAVELAERAVTLADGPDANLLDTLAAAYAEAGRFADAVQTARNAAKRAAEQNEQSLAESIRDRIPLYEAGIPFHEP